MSSKVYELSLMLVPDLSVQGISAIAKKIKNLSLSGAGISKENYGILQARYIGLVSLSYPINKFSQARYYLLKISTDPANVKPLQDFLRINESVIRSMVIDKTDENLNLKDITVTTPVKVDSSPEYKDLFKPNSEKDSISQDIAKSLDYIDQKTEK